jgi:hypothetical protein
MQTARRTAAGIVRLPRVVDPEYGRATVENIQLRCRAHNGFEAEQWFGLVREIPGAFAGDTSTQPRRHGAHARPVSSAGESWIRWKPSHEILRVCQTNPPGPRRRRARPCQLITTPSGSETDQTASMSPEISANVRRLGSTCHAAPADMTRTSWPFGCGRTSSIPPRPGRKFAVHVPPVSETNSTTSPSRPDRPQFSGTGMAAAPYGGRPGRTRKFGTPVFCPTH